MPLYEYVCKTCGQEFEKMLRFSEAGKLPECPTCQSQHTQKRLSTFATRGSSQSGSASSQSGSASSQSGSANAAGSSCSTGGRFT